MSKFKVSKEFVAGAPFVVFMIGALYGMQFVLNERFSRRDQSQRSSPVETKLEEEFEVTSKIFLSSKRSHGKPAVSYFFQATKKLWDRKHLDVEKRVPRPSWEYDK